MEFVVTAVLALGGVMWLRAMRARMEPLPEDFGPRHGGTLFVTGMVLVYGATAAIVAARGDDTTETFTAQIQVQALANVFGVWVVALLARRIEEGLGPLGLRAHRGAPPFSLALAAFFAFQPVLLGVTWLNSLLLEQIGVEAGVQDVLEAFMDDAEGQRSFLVWVLAVGLVPFCEEVMFRGLLFGALRRRVSPAAAIALSSLVFGLAHGGVALLPTAALGALFCWLYERTGSLVVPTLSHALHNGLTMAMVSSTPALLG